jgi:hypothetical protein
MHNLKIEIVSMIYVHKLYLFLNCNKIYFLTWYGLRAPYAKIRYLRLSISIERSRYNRTLGDFDYGMFLIGVKKSLCDVLITEKLVLQTGCQYTFGLG